MTDFPKIPGELLPDEEPITLADLKIGQTISIFLLHSGFEVDTDGVLWIRKSIEATKVLNGKASKDVTICVTRVPEGLSAQIAKGTKLRNVVTAKGKTREGFLPVVKYEIL